MPVRLIIEGNAVYEIDEDCFGSQKRSGKDPVENKRVCERNFDQKEKRTEQDGECSLR